MMFSYSEQASQKLFPKKCRQSRIGIFRKKFLNAAITKMPFQPRFGACLRRTGEGVVQNLGEAAGWYRIAAEQGDAWGQFSLGQFYDSSYDFGDVVPHDDVEAVNWYRKAAEQGHAEAQSSLGCCYEAGTGVLQNYDEAIRWFKKAAEQNHDTAAVKIASYFQNEMGDLVEAYKWLKIAAAQNDFWENKLNTLRASLTEEQIVEEEKRYREFHTSKK